MNTQMDTVSVAPILKPKPADVQFLESRKQFEREGVLGPISVDDRRDLGLHERTHLS